MQLDKDYDVALVGGGLAGLAAAIQLRRAGASVILFEKEIYPFHKVCGEYISLESWDFLQSLGVPLQEMNLPIINTLLLTAPNGKSFTTSLPLGGFGISRYRLDKMLADMARSESVHLMEGTKVDAVESGESFQVSFHSKNGEQGSIQAKVCCASYGKKSNLDLRWKRAFLQTHDKRLDNYVGIKYHIRTDWPEHLIGLHNFEDGYCGISRIEDGECCLCYMTKAESLKKQGNSIAALEAAVLHRNPALKKIFETATVCAQFPVTISQINFQRKTQVENGVLMLGDAAGMITPLCGNGMSIALHTGKLSAAIITQFLSGAITREQMEKQYETEWTHYFAKRLRTGRMLQRFFGSSRLSDLFVQTFKMAPFLARPLVKMTHGDPY